MSLTRVGELIELRTGRRPSRATLARWCAVGVHTRNGPVKLGAQRVGRLWIVSADAVEAFLTALNAG